MNVGLIDSIYVLQNFCKTYVAIWIIHDSSAIALYISHIYFYLYCSMHAVSQAKLIFATLQVIIRIFIIMYMYWYCCTTWCVLLHIIFNIIILLLYQIFTANGGLIEKKNQLLPQKFSHYETFVVYSRKVRTHTAKLWSNHSIEGSIRLKSPNKSSTTFKLPSIQFSKSLATQYTVQPEPNHH